MKTIQVWGGLVIPYGAHRPLLVPSVAVRTHCVYCTRMMVYDAHGITCYRRRCDAWSQRRPRSSAVTALALDYAGR